MTWIAILAGSLGAVVLVSYLVDAARSVPPAPAQLPWAPEIPVRYLNLDGVRLRYVVAGRGPTVVLLHTLRTQLDMYQRVLPALAKRFKVYALDYPGHGWSDIPKAEYSAEYLITSVARFLDAVEVEEATVVGESIGGTIALALAARRHPRVARVVAVNPYDYDGGRGIRRGSPVADILFRLAPVPVLGDTAFRLRNPLVERMIFEGGIHRAASLPPALRRELSAVGNRHGYLSGFLSLVRRWASWETVRQEYGRIDRPVLLVYGEHDWSREAEREANRTGIPGNRSLELRGAGHFLSLDAPEELVRAVSDFAGHR
jgi:pimeloyl-ACP methyl ester carboxylesterase